MHAAEHRGHAAAVGDSGFLSHTLISAGHLTNSSCFDLQHAIAARLQHDCSSLADCSSSPVAPRSNATTTPLMAPPSGGAIMRITMSIEMISIRLCVLSRSVPRLHFYSEPLQDLRKVWSEDYGGDRRRCEAGSEAVDAAQRQRTLSAQPQGRTLEQQRNHQVLSAHRAATIRQEAGVFAAAPLLLEPQVCGREQGEEKGCRGHDA